MINENDAVATAEIKVGDNDNLSALVAILVQAEQLYLLTDQQGLFDSDPRKNSEAKLIPVVEQITDHIRSIAGGSGYKSWYWWNDDQNHCCRCCDSLWN